MQHLHSQSFFSLMHSLVPGITLNIAPILIGLSSAAIRISFSCRLNPLQNVEGSITFTGVTVDCKCPTVSTVVGLIITGVSTMFQQLTSSGDRKVSGMP